MGEHDDLLRRHQPGVKYDSMEQYFADSAEQWTANPGNQLRRADTGDALGDLLAEGADLTLDFLAASAYATGAEVLKDDRIGNPGRNYREQYVALRQARPDLKNRMYGHAVEEGGRLWLQYWLYYFYNDYNLALGIGLHEGDWEMVQLRMHDDEPDLAVYAQHRQAEQRPWSEVERVPSDSERPLVYVARGSHASYFHAGYHQTEAWYDLADGKRNAPRLALEVIDADTPPWVGWPGVWGDTHARIGGVDSPSPRGPAAHAQWHHPNSLLDTAWQPLRTDAISAPEVTIVRDAGRLRVDFDFSRQARQPPTSLQITVNSRDEEGVPPRAYTFGLIETTRGTLTTRIPLDPTKHYDVYASTTSGTPPIPSESKLTPINPVGAKRGGALGEQVLQRTSRLFAWVRGHMPRRRFA
jgi:hypothetical protein